MAYKDSDELKSDERYPLGDYSFRIERSAGTSPNYDKIEAICTKDGKNARKSIQVPSSTQIDGWYVEANETEASVYIKPREVHAPWLTFNIEEFDYSSYMTSGKQYVCPVPINGWYIGGGNATETIYAMAYNGHAYFAKPNSSMAGYTDKYKENVDPKPWNPAPFNLIESSSYRATYPYFSQSLSHDNIVSALPESTIDPIYISVEGYSGLKGDTLVGRFAIDIEEAGGVGPESDWIDPGDYDPDWEEGDPTHTLYVEVTGALSGRHNDPIEDPSYSYIPADKDTVKDYGCGGDGGHGGGGGAGASTVVVHKFATNQANSKEVTAIAKRHGYGSGGGKGGKGGDGCILVYY